MKLFPPDPKIKLYKQGFPEPDLFNRAAFGKQVSALVERIEDPMVIALDGQWGSGKSYFLKCWVGAHILDKSNSAKTIYFDAFENDFLDEPLVSLTTVIGERLKSDKKLAPIWETVKTAARILAVPTIRTLVSAGANYASGGAYKLAADAIENAGSALADQAEDFLKQEDGKRAAMKSFKEAITKLTNPKEGPPNKLVIAIDELDRCRPDYALSMLEVIKHFFEVENVHFILGVNLSELENSVRARYGEGVAARKYLQKFISVTMSLPNKVDQGGVKATTALAYFKHMANEMELEHRLTKAVLVYLNRPSVSAGISIREVQKILSEMALTPSIPEVLGRQFVIAGLLVMKVIASELYQKALFSSLTIEDMQKAFPARDLRTDERDDQSDRYFDVTWKTCLTAKSISSDVSHEVWRTWLRDQPRLEIIPSLIRDYIEAFEINAD
ncbi:MAG: KAP family P-loop NTPase fold protein [Paracoccaceae bacterium]